MKTFYTTILTLFCFISYSQDFEVSPLQLFFNSEAGESQSKFIKVKNHSGKTETYILKINDVSINSKGQKEYEDAGSLKNSIADWISIAPSFFELKPNEEKEIAVTVQQPANEYGSKWGVILINTAKEQTSWDADKSLSAGMSVTSRIAVDVFQTPGSNKNFKAKITNLSEITQSKDSTRTFTALVNNLGDIITPCKVYLIVTNIYTAEEFLIPQYDFSMYPKSSRKIEMYLKQDLPSGLYSLAAILDYGSRENLEGTQMQIKVE